MGTFNISNIVIPKSSYILQEIWAGHSYFALNFCLHWTYATSHKTNWVIAYNIAADNLVDMAAAMITGRSLNPSVEPLVSKYLLYVAFLLFTLFHWTAKSNIEYRPCMVEF